MCENGPIASEDEASSKEDIESDGKDTLETISNEEQTTLPKKVILTKKFERDKRCDLIPLAGYVNLDNSLNLLPFYILKCKKSKDGTSWLLVPLQYIKGWFHALYKNWQNTPWKNPFIQKMFYLK